MADNDQELDQNHVPVPPPKETPFPKADPGGSDPRRSSHITAPPEAAMPASGGGSPRRTSRLAVPPGAGGEELDTTAAPRVVPKTIRMVRSPAAPGAAVSSPRPGDHPLPPGPKPLSPPQMQATKSTTSRISLEAAIGAESPTPSSLLASPDGAPKTIRLKRPSEMPTLKVPAVRPQTAGGAGGLSGVRPNAPTPSHATRSKTAQITEPEGTTNPDTAGTDSFVPLTQKRTIRVRRPSASSAEARSTAEESQDESALTPLSPAESLGKVADTCNPMFIVAAAASIVVTGVLVFMFYQQLYGPASFY